MGVPNLWIRNRRWAEATARCGPTAEGSLTF